MSAVIDKGKLLEYLKRQRSNCRARIDAGDDSPIMPNFINAFHIVSGMVNSGELDPDPVKCDDCNCQEFHEDPNQLICKKCGRCVDKKSDQEPDCMCPNADRKSAIAKKLGIGK